MEITGVQAIPLRREMEGSRQLPERDLGWEYHLVGIAVDEDVPAEYERAQ